jgi:predicted ATPase/DNA-binding CsgD family transcriptional regulator
LVEITKGARVTPHVGTALTPLIGRNRELRALETRLANGARLITLTGPGGSGKTTLARELFVRHQGSGAEVYFVDLVGVGDPALVPAEIATELGVTETADLDAAAAVLAALRERTAALVLDNLEELTGARDFLAALLQAAPGLHVIATSRVPLGIPGEVEFHVPPLELPPGDEPAVVEASPAGALFLERARAVGRLDEVDVPTAKAIAELCRRLDGLPLALELAAARTRILPPAAILRHFDQQTFGLLARVDERDIRHRSLDAVLAWSLDLLGSNEAEVLGAVAVCPGGFDLAIAEALGPGLNVLQAIDVLATHGLLVQRGEIEGEPWYQLLETIRVAALERTLGGSTSARWQRLASHLSGRVAATLEAYNRNDGVAFRRLDALLDDVRAVLDWTEVNDPPLNLFIAANFCWYWRVRGRSREGVLRLYAAIASNRNPTSALALAHNGLAKLERERGRLLEAGRAAAEAAQIARIVGDREREVDGLADLINGAERAIPEASDRLRELLPELEHPVYRWMCLTGLAWAEVLESGFDAETAIRRYQDAERALAGTPYRRLQGVGAANLVHMYMYGNRPIDAYGHSKLAIEALSEAGPEMLVYIHSLRATAGAMIGRFREAKASLRLAFEFADSGGVSLLSEVMIAATAVLALSNTPLLAVKVWGATIAGESGGYVTDLDRSMVERLLVAARRATDPVAFEVAFKEGQKAGVVNLRDEVLAHLDDIVEAAGLVGIVRLAHGALTRRELEVLALVGAGKSDTDIAADLFISPKTASVHVSNAKAKLGLETRLEAALWARERGLVDGEPEDS